MVGGVGCLGKLKQSIENFNQTYLQPGILKHDIFNPKTPFNGSMFLLSNHAPSVDDHKPDTLQQLYRCTSYTKYYGGQATTDKDIFIHGDYKRVTIRRCDYVTEYVNAKCPKCGCVMNVPLTSYTPEKEAEAERKKQKMTGGYVKEMVTYIVMDDLVVKPMSTLSSITLINNSGVKDLTQLEEKTVPFGKDEALKLLKASLMTDQVLTTLFRKTITLFPKTEDD